MDPFRRSGKHYQFAFRLHGMVSLDKGQHQWRQHTAAIYHHFDVQTGSALWMLTAPLDQPSKSKRKNFLWERVKKHIHHESGGVTGFQITHEEGYERFRGSLQVIAAIVEWSLEDCSVYAHELSERIAGVVCTECSPHRCVLANVICFRTACGCSHSSGVATILTAATSKQ